MERYEKPIVLMNEDISEGIYAASGSGSKESKCDSKYFKGTWHQMIYTTNPISSDRGCEGCYGNWNDGSCHVQNYERKEKDQFMPSWEKAGLSPDSPWNR